MAKHTSIKEAYMLGNGYKESCRLHTQHYLWGQQVGWQLNPKVKLPEGEVKVVDVGCGNGVWLLEVARQAPPTWSFLGLDVSPANFPHPDNLPKNVRFEARDVFDDLPLEFVGAFDLLHLRAFAVVVKGGDAGPICRNLMHMVKPGGFFQWDEFDAGMFGPAAPNPHTSMEKTLEVFDRWHKYSARGGLEFGWISNLSSVMSGEGAEVLDSFRQLVRPDLRKTSTDNFVTALEAVGAAWSKDSAFVASPEEWQELWYGLVEEVGRGVSVSMDIIEVLGRKPLATQSIPGA